MNIWDILIAAGIILLACAAVRHLYRTRRQGGCSCGCGSCSKACASRKDSTADSRRHDRPADSERQ